MGTILADTDAVIALAQSKLGNSFLYNASSLELTDGVYAELTGPRQKPGEDTRKAACVAEYFLKNNSSFSPPGNKTVGQFYAQGIEDISSIIAYEYPDVEFGLGELSILQYVTKEDNADIEFDVVYFDSDIKKLVTDNQFKQRADLFPATTPLDRMDVEKDKKINAALKTAVGCDWTSRNQLKTLLVKSGILTRSKFNNTNGRYGYPQLELKLDTINPDVEEMYEKISK